uniref:branched-chain-amino-acid transaminase n=1 Tax=Denticeps clupeoides TaxID=299321 RepID=A0AAY4B9F8_9TELE
TVYSFIYLVIGHSRLWEGQGLGGGGWTGQNEASNMVIEMSSGEGWQKPHIRPFGNLSLHPACSSLHYAVQLFEGMKAYRGQDNRVRLFRPMLNMNRMLKSAKRACLPSFNEAELLECIRKLVEVDQEWVPYSDNASLYIRPHLLALLLYVILSPVAAYFSTGAKAVSLWADCKYIRAWKGRHRGLAKWGYEALDYGCQQVLWLYGDDHQITEVGTMNLFLKMLSIILDLINMTLYWQSILELARKWVNQPLAIKHEWFGSGTACVVCPVSRILYQGEVSKILE